MFKTRRPYNLSPMKAPASETRKTSEWIKAKNVIRDLFLMPVILLLMAKPLRAADAMVADLDDATICAQIKTSLLRHLSMNFQVMTKEGVVTLSGSAVDIAEIDQNTKLAAEIIGVKNVINNMVIPAVVARND